VGEDQLSDYGSINFPLAALIAASVRVAAPSLPPQRAIAAPAGEQRYVWYSSRIDSEPFRPKNAALRFTAID
jgi:hypothetical protein